MKIYKILFLLMTHIMIYTSEVEETKQRDLIEVTENNDRIQAPYNVFNTIIANIQSSNQPRSTTYAQLIQLITTWSLNINQEKPNCFTPFQFAIQKIGRAVHNNPSALTEEDRTFMARLINDHNGDTNALFKLREKGQICDKEIQPFYDYLKQASFFKKIPNLDCTSSQPRD